LIEPVVHFWGHKCGIEVLGTSAIGRFQKFLIVSMPTFFQSVLNFTHFTIPFLCKRCTVQILKFKKNN